MKQIVSLNEDFIIKVGFNSKYITGGTPDWVDETKTKANGSNLVHEISLLTKEYGNDGYPTGKMLMIRIDKGDILKLAEKIMEIESEKVTGTPDDDLPY